MEKWNLNDVKEQLNQLSVALEEYIMDYSKGRTDDQTFQYIVINLMSLFWNGLSYFQPLSTNETYFYYIKKLGQDYIKRLPNLKKDEVDAFFYFLYKLNVLDLNYIEFENFQSDVLEMLRYYIKYFEDHTDQKVN